MVKQFIVPLKSVLAKAGSISNDRLHRVLTIAMARQVRLSTRGDSIHITEHFRQVLYFWSSDRSPHMVSRFSQTGGDHHFSSEPFRRGHLFPQDYTQWTSTVSYTAGIVPPLLRDLSSCKICIMHVSRQYFCTRYQALPRSFDSSGR